MTGCFEIKSISELIKELEKMKKEFGDVTLKFCENEMTQKFKELEKENAELICQMKRNFYCYSCKNATERCYKKEIGCPCGKYKSYKEENADEKLDAQTEHERKLLLTTPITMDCFDIDFDSEEWKNYCMSEWKNLIEVLDSVRITARETNNAEIIRHFLKMLPNSYKVVKIKELDDMTSGGVSVLENVASSKEKLTKAKKLIQNLLNAFASNDFFEEEELDAMSEAEQFLKE